MSTAPEHLPTSSIHTMQDDLMLAKPPSRFDLRHQRSLSKSKQMEDLRSNSPSIELDNHPWSAHSYKATTLQAPDPANNTIKPIVLGTAIAILSVVLLLIIMALITSLA